MLLCICTDFQVDRAIHDRDLRGGAIMAPPPRNLSSQNSPGKLGLNEVVMSSRVMAPHVQRPAPPKTYYMQGQNAPK